MVDDMRTRADGVELSIVVPVYNSQTILPKLCLEVERALNESRFSESFELILVNDCSPDDSWRVIKRLAANHPCVRGVSLRKNFGQHSATMAGLRVCSGKYVVVMDDDLQHPPSEILRMVTKLEMGADICYTKYLNRKHSLWKRLGSSFNNVVATILLDKPKGLYLSSFKAMRREIVDEIVKYDGPYPYLDGLILDVSRRIEIVDIEHHAREDGAGNYNLYRSISLWAKMATSFSVFPLRLVTFFGAFVSALSLIAFLLVVGFKLFYPGWPAGWASLISVILFIGGAQMLSLGLIGEYLGRAYLRLNGKPQYVIAETLY